MDIPQIKNKIITNEEAENKEVRPTTVRAASTLENEYFYPQANGYQAITVRAATLQDANAIYLARRKPVSPETKKVEDSNTD